MSRAFTGNDRSPFAVLDVSWDAQRCKVLQDRVGPGVRVSGLGAQIQRSVGLQASDCRVTRQIL